MYCKPLIIIPARGGSKGIPHKNIVPLGGKPLLVYTIEAALQTATIDNIILSTDDDAIAAVAESAGLPVHYRRPSILATDTAGSREVILHAMEWADENAISYDCIVLLQPTSPLRNANDITKAISLYTPTIDMVVSVTDASSNPYYNCFECDNNGYLNISKGDGLITRRQDAPPAYEYNGAIYVINPVSIRNMAMGAFSRKVPYIMPRDRSIDIDTPLDLAVAEVILSNM